MRLLVLQHVEFETPGMIADWAVERGHRLDICHLYNEDELPKQKDFDLLAIMGGPMNIYEEEQYPWLKREKQFIRDSILAEKKVLGICLGAQLMADVLGGPVICHSFKEIGWHPVRLTLQGKMHPLLKDWPLSFTPFHWHGDTFAIPKDAVRAAQSEACENQLFIWGDRAVGLQFHLEYSESNIRAMMNECSDELVDGPYIQDASRFLEDPSLIQATRELLFQLLDNLDII